MIEGAKQQTARVAVHFQSIEDKFRPHDAVFAFTTPAELKETALSSEIALHTAASIKSTSESQLSGITEDETDTRSEATQKPDISSRSNNQELSSSQRDDDAQTRHAKATEIISAMRNHETSSSATPSLHQRTTSDTNKALPPPPTSLARDRSKPRSIYEFETRPVVSSSDGRMSSQSARPSTRDLNGAYEYKPKVKLGPRPSTDSPQRPGRSDLNGGFRPVAALPAGLRMPVRKLASGRPKSAHKNPPFISTPPPSIPLPPPPPSMANNIRSTTASPSKDGQLASAKASDSKNAKMTPEKKRLMKALQLRQQHLSKQKQSEAECSKEVPQSESVRSDLQALEIDSSYPEHHRLSFESGRSVVNVPHSGDMNIKKSDSKETNADFHEEPQDSPTSGPEPSDGPSTQASSVSEEDPSMQKSSHTSGETIQAQSPSMDSSSTTQVLQQTIETTVRELEQQPPQDSALAEPQVTSGAQLSNNVIAGQTVKGGDGTNMQARETNEVATTAFGGDGQNKEPLSTASSVHLPQNPQDAISEEARRNVLQDIQPDIQNVPSEGSDPASPYGPRFPDVVDQLDDPMQNENAEPRDINFRSNEHIGVDPQSMAVPPSPPIPSEPSNVPISDVEDDGDSLRKLTSSAAESVAAGSLQGSTPEVVEQSQQARKAETETMDPFTGASQVLPIVKRDISEVNSMQARSAASDVSLPNVVETSSPQAQVSQESEEHLLDGETTATRPSTADTVKGPLDIVSLDDTQAVRRKKRRGVVSPLKRTSSPDQSDEHFLSDESFMEELKTASVQQAKPVSVSVSKSPIRPIFAQPNNDYKGLEKPKAIRTISSPIADFRKDEQDVSPSTVPTPSSARSFSASSSPFLNSQSTFVPQPKKIGVSSSISQRIKALEQLSSRPTSPVLQNTPQTTFISLRERKSSLKSPPGTPDLHPVNVSASRPGTDHSSPQVANPESTVRSASQRPESVTVTATIVRSASDSFPERSLNLSEPRNLDLHKSPLIVEHQTMEPPRTLPLQPPRPPYCRHASARSGSSTSTEHKKESESAKTRRESFASWRSGSSRNGSDQDLPRSPSDKSLGSIVGIDGMREEKRDSKRSRMLKRMSSSITMSRRSIASAWSPGPKEASIVEHQEPVIQLPPSIIDLGDVSIQFPDTLLWKRRHMLVDEHGILVIAPSATDKNSKILTKRFPLSNFRPPYLPDQDRQELANSKQNLTRYQ